MLKLSQLIDYYMREIFIDIIRRKSAPLFNPKTNFRPLHLWGDSFGYLFLISAPYIFDLKPSNEVGAENLTKQISKIPAENLPIQCISINSLALL